MTISSKQPMSIFHCKFQKPSFLLTFLLATVSSFAQKAGLEVTRCSAIDRSVGVVNVMADFTGHRYAANKKGVFQVKANDLATPVPVDAGMMNVLSFKGGNANYAWPVEKFREQVTTPCTVTAAWYDLKTQMLWLGTDEAGLIQFSTQPEFKMLQQYLPVNSKLKSPNISTIFQDASGRLWVGNEGGLMYGAPGRWKAALSGFTAERVREFNGVIYVLSEGIISRAPGGEKWSDLPIEDKYIDGDVRDFDIDPAGKLWLLSGIVTRHDMTEDTYDTFGGPEYYTSEYGTCIAVDQDGAVWIGTSDKGLYSIDKASNLILNLELAAPISCEGNGRDAALSAKVTGGTPPFTYNWNAGLSGDRPAGLGAGTYLVTVTDSKGISRTAERVIADNRLKLKVRQKKPASSATAADGSAEVDIATNASGIVITWDNGENKVQATQLTPGEHKVTVADPKGCTMTLTVTITVQGQALQADLKLESNIQCAGQTGLLVAKVTGGKTPYQYTWSNPSFKGDRATVKAGDYSVTVTDAAGATTTAEISVGEPAALSLTATPQGIASAGGADGKAIAQAKGGTGIYTFKWDSGETTFNAVKLTEGNHAVTATDANGCVATSNVKIDAKVDAFAVILREARPIRCHGEKTNLTVAAVGGKTPYREYQWSPAVKLSEGVGAGTYSVTATDAAGTTATATIVIKEPKKLTVSTLLQAGTSPGKSDGKALAIVEGGTGSMFFRWDNSEATAATNELSPGLHYVTVTDENACTQTASVFIPEGIDPLKVTLSERDRIRCSGGKAVLEVRASGGKEPYQYVWSVPSVKGTNPAVAAGDYVLTVTDGSGATATVNISVKQPDLLAATVTANAPAGIGASDGKAAVDIIGGTTPYKISWDNGEDTREASRLVAGRHTVSVTDANACAATATIVIPENILPLSVIIRETAPVKCPGDKAGLEVSVTGGKSPFRYVWSASSLAGERVSAPAGTYTVTLTDAAGTTASAAIQVSQPAQLTVTAAVTAPAGVGASDGKASVTAAGGTAPFNFSWSSGESGASASRLSAGKHGVTATDANGCAGTASIEITENILPLSAAVSETGSIKCAGQKTSLEVKIAGGKGPFKYVWNTPSVTGASPGVSAGEYTVTVTDVTGNTASASAKVNQPAQLTISASMKSPAGIGASDGKALAKVNGGTEPYAVVWSNGETAVEASALKSGAHTVTVTDANGCTAATGLGIDENIPPLTISLSEIVAPRCAGDKTTLSADVNGGKKPYKFVWSDPNIESGKPLLLSTGMYGFTVTDATGNTASSSISVKMQAQLTATAEVQAPASTGGTDGKATVKATGGVQPFTFSWSSGETTAAASALPPGKQTVTVTDANGCVATATAEIKENILALTVALTEEKSIKCAGDKATLNIKVTGGKGPFVYTWNNPAASGNNPSGLDAGSYTVTVTDVKGVTKTASVTLRAVTPLEVTLIRNIGATSERNNDGKAELTVKGGTPKYSIVWDTRQTGLSAPKLPLGKHSVTVTDANGCARTIDFETEKRILPELTGSLENGQTIRMRLLNFDTDSSTIKPEALPMLDELFDFMTENSAVVIEIAGHTNNLPSDAFADQLSTARAKAVADYLAAKGIDSKRLIYKGYGKRLPLVPNTSAEGRKTNQRVEIKILKVKE